MNERSYPETEDFDRYRSGLLDDEPEAKRRVEASPSHAPKAGLLRAVTAHLDEAAERELGIANELRRRRREVLSGRRRLAPRFGLPALVTSAVASVIVGIAIGLLVGRATLSPVLPLVALDELEEAGDVVENLDFYDWLEGQNQTGGAPQSGT